VERHKFWPQIGCKYDCTVMDFDMIITVLICGNYRYNLGLLYDFRWTKWNGGVRLSRQTQKSILKKFSQKTLRFLFFSSIYPDPNM
jgi:hypothetical protein